MDTLRTLEPMHRVCQVSNLWHWRLAPDSEGILLRRSRWLEIYGWAISAAAVCYAVYGLFRESGSGNGDGEEADKDSETIITSIGHTVDFIQLVGMRVAHIAALLEALWQRQAQRDFYAELGEIDGLLARDLGVDVEGGRLRMRSRTSRQAMWTLTGYAFSQGLILVAKLMGPGNSFPLYWVCYLLPLLVSGLRYFQIFTTVQIVRQRLDVLLLALRHLQLQQKPRKGGEENQCGMELERELEMELEQAAMQRLVGVRVAYQRIWALVALLNRCFGFSMLFLVGNDFLAITSNCYWMFLNFRQSAASPFDILQIVASAVWSAPHLGNVLVLSLLCDRTAQCATCLALSLHQVGVDLRNESHNALVGFDLPQHDLHLILSLSRLKITQFSLQLLHQRLHFSASGFFNVDCTLLYTIVGATTTYLIILIQFHMSEGTRSAG
ncbi:hypothetical protein KR009_009457 [Drosophila setifemur]|nr:hypothetical protein KR009_009457 [Drosophila setifemur]